VSGYAGFLPFFLLFYEIKFFDMNVMKTAQATHTHTHTHKASFFFYGIEILFLKIKKEKKTKCTYNWRSFFGVCLLCVSNRIFVVRFFFFVLFYFIFLRTSKSSGPSKKNLRA
jgi:hypothetical protein